MLFIQCRIKAFAAFPLHNHAIVLSRDDSRPFVIVLADLTFALSKPLELWLVIRKTDLGRIGTRRSMSLSMNSRANNTLAA